MPHPLRFWERTEARPALVLSLAAVVLGIVGAVAAFVLFRLIALLTNVAFYQRLSFATRYPPDHLQPWMILIPALGGLLVGLMAYYGTERIRGHGIPEAMEAIIAKRSRVDVGVAILKPLSAAVAVGTGGPFGAEGPIIQTGGAIGSLIGQALELTAAERRVFLACGAAAGMVGIFNTPITAVALALELLLFEFRPRSLIPVVVASAVAAATRPYLLGAGPMFAVPAVDYGGLTGLVLLVPLAIAIGVAAVIVSKGLFRVEVFFEETLGLPVALAPAIGGLALGLIALAEPRILGMGYPTITAVVEGRVDALGALKLGAAKCLGLWAALGSGTSGGLLAPMLLIGGSLGSAYGQVVAALLPGAQLSPEIYAIVGMSALFGAAARAPITSFLFGYELTGDVHAIIPLMIGCMAADVVARLLSEYSVMTERLARRGVSVPQVLPRDLLSYLRVRALLRTDCSVVAEDIPVRDVLRSYRRLHWRAESVTDTPTAWDHRIWIVVRPNGDFVGAVTSDRLLEAPEDAAILEKPVRAIATPIRATVYPDESLQDALATMLRNNLSWIAVVERPAPRRVVGYVTADDALAAGEMDLENEVLRESIVRPSLFRPGAELAQDVERRGRAG